MAIGASKLSDMPKGAYWYMVPGKEPAICEKREGEAFVRFTNGSRQEWVRDSERFVGQLAVPIAAEIN